MKRKVSTTVEEKNASKLSYLSSTQIDKHQLLRTTLDKIDLRNSESDTEAQYLTLGTDNTDHSISRNKSYEVSSIMSKLKLYVPLTAIVVVMVLTGGIILRRTNSPVVDSTPSIVANGSVKNVSAALTQDLISENTIDKELVIQSQEATQDIVTAIQQVGDISNDTSF